MTRMAGADAVVALPPEEAQALWTDVRRWPSFVEGFARELRRSGDWPSEGAKLEWESTPEGRGRVTEQVTANEPGAFATQVFEQRLTGTQAVAFEPTEEEGSVVTLRLEYELTGTGPLSGITDLLFIRRALRDSLTRTLRRYAIEAEEQAGLR
jgi:Polyketide cyclase / dehydrase and lipid transport